MPYICVFIAVLIVDRQSHPVFFSVFSWGVLVNDMVWSSEMVWHEMTRLSSRPPFWTIFSNIFRTVSVYIFVNFEAM